MSPLGLGVPAFWDGLVAGRCAIAPIAGFPADDLTPRAAAEVRTVPADDPDRAGTFALLAAREALEAAQLDTDELGAARAGVAVGTTLGGMQLFERWDLASAAGEPLPPSLAAVPYYGPAVRLARAFRVSGPVATAQLACASGTEAIALAADWVRTGRADVVLAGGTDLLCRFVVAGFNALRATAEVARPFDRARAGLVLGEGAAVVVVEDEERARERGATLRARVMGTGAAGDAVHMTAPDRTGGGAVRAISAALVDAGLPPAAVDFVSAHGTGTPYNDAMETVALARIFGVRGVAVDSIKGAIGHSLGAAGAFEAVLCVEALAHGRIPPTVGLQDVDPACAVLDLVYGAARERPLGVALSTSSGFAGANAALVLSRA